MKEWFWDKAHQGSTWQWLAEGKQALGWFRFLLGESLAHSTGAGAAGTPEILQPEKMGLGVQWSQCDQLDKYNKRQERNIGKKKSNICSKQKLLGYQKRMTEFLCKKSTAAVILVVKDGILFLNSRIRQDIHSYSSISSAAVIITSAGRQERIKCIESLNWKSRLPLLTESMIVRIGYLTESCSWATGHHSIKKSMLPRWSTDSMQSQSKLQQTFYRNWQADSEI